MGKVLGWFAGFLVLAGLFGWAFQGGRAARTEAYRASVARHAAEGRLASRTRAWVRVMASRHVSSGGDVRLCPASLSAIDAIDAGDAPVLHEMASVLRLSARLSGGAEEAENVWCREVLPEWVSALEAVRVSGLSK